MHRALAIQRLEILSNHRYSDLGLSFLHFALGNQGPLAIFLRSRMHSLGSPFSLCVKLCPTSRAARLSARLTSSSLGLWDEAGLRKIAVVYQYNLSIVSNLRASWVQFLIRVLNVQCFETTLEYGGLK